MLTDYPAFVRLYDLLIVEDEDLRPLSWEQRREMLEAFVPRLDPERFDISPVIPATSLDELAAIRDGARDAAIEGIMLKRRDSPYVAGRRTGLRSEEHTSELQSLMRISYAVFCLKKKKLNTRDGSRAEMRTRKPHTNNVPTNRIIQKSYQNNYTNNHHTNNNS